MTDNALIQEAQCGSMSAREKIISDNTALVWSIARRFAGRGADLDDIFQIGCIGMLKAIFKFDTGYGVVFSTYAVPLIIGEIKRFLRDDGIIKVGRKLRQTAIAALNAREKYINDYGREPTVAQLASLIGCDAETVITALEASEPCEYLYKKTDDCSDTYFIDKISYDLDNGDTNVDSLAVRLAMDTLDVKDRQIIQQRYFFGKTQSEIAKEMNVSQVQISRREKKILMTLRGILST